LSSTEQHELTIPKVGTLTAALAFPEMFTACVAGISRRIASMRNDKIQNTRFSDQSDWDIDICGAIAEKCFAKINGLYWAETVNTFKLPDVGTWHVRGTYHPRGHLIIRPKDTGDRAALVTLDYMTGTLRGWFDVADAKREKADGSPNEFWRGDSWWVPQHKLIQFEVAR